MDKTLSPGDGGSGAPASLSSVTHCSFIPMNVTIPKEILEFSLMKSAAPIFHKTPHPPPSLVRFNLKCKNFFFSHIILGDVNGEIHVISIQNLQFYHVEKFTDLGNIIFAAQLLFSLMSCLFGL